MNRKELGAFGESTAVDYLKAHGYRIVQRNFRCRLGEIDVIAKKGGETYFVEVKTRKGDRFGSSFESITLKKQRQIVKIAKYFLMGQKEDIGCHFSVIGIDLDKSAGPRIEFIPDAFWT